jgi:hypothetical protein
MKTNPYSGKITRLGVFLLLLLSGIWQQTWAQCGSVASYIPTVNSNTICSTNNLYIYATGLPVSKWLYRDNNTGGWNVINAATDNMSQYISVTTATTRSFRAVVSTLSCPADTTAAVTVNLTPAVYGNNPSVKLSTSAAKVCSGGQFTIRMMNQGLQANSWVYRDNGGAWYSYTFSTSSEITAAAPVTATPLVREFRVLVKNGNNCNVDSSSSVAILVNPTIAGYNPNVRPAPGQASVCGGTGVNLQIDWPLEVGSWIYKDAGSNTWQEFTSNTTNAYDGNTNVLVSGMREYRVILKNPNTCSADTSDPCYVMINASLRRVLKSIQPRINGTNTQVCAGSSLQFQITGYSNISGWIYKDSADGNWVYYSSSTAPSISSPSNLTKDITREVRVVINNSSTTCSYDTSAPVFYTIKANVKGYTTTSVPFTTNDVLCVGAQPTIYMQNNQTVTAWLYHNNNTGTWTNTFNSGNQYTDGSTSSFTVNTLRSYKAVITNTTLCRIDTTPEVSVQYKVPVVGGTIAITPTVNQSSYCAGSSVSGNISLNNNRGVSKWIYRDNNTGAWLDLQSSSTFFSDFNTNVTGATVRAYRALVRSYETFTVDTSIEVTVNINPVTRGTVGVTPTTTVASVCNQNSVTMNIVPPTGYAAYSWMYRDTVTSGWINLGSSSTNYTMNISTTNTKRSFRVILLNATICKYDTTNILAVPVLQKVVRNNTAYVPVISETAVCGGATFSMNISLPSGASVSRWIYRENGSAWKATTSSSSSYFESSSNTKVLVPTLREYKVVVNDNNNCFSDTSAGVTNMINPLLNGATSGLTPTTTTPVSCAGNTINAQVNYNGTIQKWVYRDNGGMWTEFAGSTNSTYLYDYNYLVTGVTNREYRAYLMRANSCAVDTSQTVAVQIRPLNYGNASAIQPTASAATICSGNTAVVSISSATGYDTYKWIYQDGLSTEWREFTSNTASSSLNDSKTAVNSNLLRSYRAIIRTTTCSYDTTQAVSVLINSRVYGYANATTVTSGTGVYCSSSPISVNVVSSTMPAGASIRTWLYRDNASTAWIAIPNSTSTFFTHNNTTVTVPTTRSYRVVLNNSTTCSYDSSSIFSVSINPSGAGYATTITPTISTTSVCNATTNPTLSVSLPSGYSIVGWVVNNNNEGWTGFGYATNNTFITDYNTAVQTPVSRSYRAIVTNSNTCSVDSTNAVGASINPAVRGVLNTVVPTSVRSNYCYTKTVQASVSTPSGYSIEKWIYNDNNGEWNNFANSTTSSSLSDNNTYVSAVTSRSYRVIMFNATTCQRDTTAALTVVLNPRSSSIGTRAILPTSNPATGICSGSNVTLITAPGTGNELYKWTYSDNGVNGPWYDMLGSYNQTTFTHSLTQVLVPTSRLYRAIITDTSTCDFDSTQALLVNILPITYGNDTSISVSGADSVCVGTTVSLSVAPGSGNSVTKWIYRDNGGVWTNFTNSTQTTNLNDANTQLAPGSSRGYSPLIMKSSICRIDTLTKVKNVYFKTKTYGSGITTVNVTVDTVCAGNTLNVTTSGSVEKWVFRDGTTGNWSEINNASTFLSHSATGVLTSGWRYYKALLNTGSCNADSTLADSVFLKVQTRGNIAVAPTTGNATVCSGNSVNMSLSVSNANMQMWLYRDNGAGNWNILSSTTSFSVTDYNTTVPSATSREYRAIILRTCSYDTTDALTVTITPKVNGKDNTKVPTATSTSVCAASAVQNIQVTAGSGNVIMQWLSRDNGGAWQVFASGNQNNLTDYNTIVGKVVTREYVAIIDNNTSCKYDTTATLTVTITPVVLGNSSRTVTAPALACMNSSYNVTMNVVTDTTVIRFLSSYNGGAWSDEGYINPTTNASMSRYAYNGTPYNIRYRAVMYKAGNCHIDTTAPVTVNINPRSYGNDNTITPSGSGTVCSGSPISLSVSAGSGNTIANWIYSDGNGVWTPYYTSSSSISVGENTNSTINRQYRALIVKGNACTIDTSAAKAIVINPLVYGTDTSAVINITTGTSACIGSTIAITTNPNPNSLSKWLYRDNGGNWNQIYQSANTISDVNTFVSSNVNRIYSAIIWKQATCHMDTIKKTDTIAITPRTFGTDTNMTISPSSSSICIGNAITLTGSIGTNTVQTWYYRDNGGAWNVLSSGATSSITDYNTGVSVNTTREYRMLIKKSNTCALDTSKSVAVSISPRTVGVDNTIVPTVSKTSACAGSVLSISVTPGGSNSIQKWIYRQNGGAWTDFSLSSSSAISDYNTNVSVSTTREYRAIIVKGSGCSIDTSASVMTTISPVGFGNQNTVIPTASKATLCSGSNVTIAVSGFTGASVLRWLYRDNLTGNWNDLYSAATAITDFNTQTATGFTRQYRALINNTTSGCSTDTTAAVSVAVSAITNGTIPTPLTVSQATVCAGGPVNVLINPGAGKVVTAWLSRDAGSDWTVFSTTSATSVNDFNTGVTTNTIREYRAIVSNTAGCSMDSSAPVSVSINIITAGTNLNITPNTTTPTMCSGSTAIVAISGFSGTVVKWLYRDSVIDGWNNIFNTNFTLFHNSTFVSYPRTRTYCAIVYNANNCSYDTTASVQLQINPQLAGNANAIAPTSTAGTTACSGTTINLSATGFINGGSVTGWVMSDNGGAWVKLNNLSGASINHLISVTGPVTRQYRALVLTGCSTDTTAALTMTLDIVPAKPTITNPAGTDSLICNETAATYEWRLNGNIIPGATGNVHVATVSGTYSVQVGNTAACKALSDDLVHGMVGLEKVFANTNITLFPNPTQTGTVTLGWEGLAVHKVKVVVMDMMGREVMSKEADVLSTQSMDLDLSKENPGMYFVTISSQGDSVTRKVSYQK